MKYLDEFGDAELAKRLLDDIAESTTQNWALMEVCGGQTHTIIRNGIDQLLPDQIELIHGPGCPVCVTPLETIDRALAIAARPDVIFCSFGDMIRVPGSSDDLYRIKSRGGDTDRPGEPRQAGRLLRRGLRDHRTGQRDDRKTRQAAGHRQLLAAGLACTGAACDPGDHGLAQCAGAGLPRSGSRMHCHGPVEI